MSHVNYHRWLTLIQMICAREFPSIKPAVFEMGGGTGVLGKMLAENGFSYIGSDLSVCMCKQAVLRNLPFFCSDARHPAIKKRFHLILFLYDGINYMSSLPEYEAICEQAYHLLCDNGLFLFDITTEKNSLANFYDIVDGEDFADTAYIRHSYYERAAKIQHNDFAVFIKSERNPLLFQKEKEFHRQRIFSPGEIAGVIPESLFTIEGIYDNFSLQEYTEMSERIHFLLKKRKRHD